MLPLHAVISAVVGIFFMYQAATNPRLSIIPWSIDSSPPVAPSTTTTTTTAAASPVTVVWTVTETISFTPSSLPVGTSAARDAAGSDREPVWTRAFALSNTAWFVALVVAVLVAGLLLGRRFTRANAPVYQPPFDFSKPQRVNLIDSIDLDELLPWVPFSLGPLDSPHAELVSSVDKGAQDEQEESCDDSWSILSAASDEERIDGLERDIPEVDEGTSGNNLATGSDETKESTNSSQDFAVTMPGAFPEDYEDVADRCLSPTRDAATTEPPVLVETPCADEATSAAITAVAEEVGNQSTQDDGAESDPELPFPIDYGTGEVVYDSEGCREETATDPEEIVDESTEEADAGIDSEVPLTTGQGAGGEINNSEVGSEVPTTEPHLPSKLPVPQKSKQSRSRRYGDPERRNILAARVASRATKKAVEPKRHALSRAFSRSKSLEALGAYIRDVKAIDSSSEEQREEVKVAEEAQVLDNAPGTEANNQALGDDGGDEASLAPAVINNERPSEEQFDELEVAEENETFEAAPGTEENNQALGYDEDHDASLASAVINDDAPAIEETNQALSDDEDDEASLAPAVTNDDIEMDDAEEVVAEYYPSPAGMRPLHMSNYRNSTELDADSDDDSDSSEADLNEFEDDTEVIGQEMDLEIDPVATITLAMRALSAHEPTEELDIELPDYHEVPCLNKYFSWTRPDVPTSAADPQQNLLGGVVNQVDSEMDVDGGVVNPVEPELDVDGGVLNSVDPEMDIDGGFVNPADSEMESDAQSDSQSLLDAYSPKVSHAVGALTQGSGPLPSALGQFPATTQQGILWPSNMGQMQQHQSTSAAASASKSALTSAGGVLNMTWPSSATREVAKEPVAENQQLNWGTGFTAALSVPPKPKQLKNNSRPQYGYKNARPDRQPNRRITHKTAATHAQDSMPQGAAIHDFKRNYNSDREREVMDHWHNSHNGNLMTTQHPEQPVNPLMMPQGVNATLRTQSSSSHTHGAHPFPPSVPATGTTGNDQAAMTPSATGEMQMRGNCFVESSQQVTPVSHAPEQKHAELSAEGRLVAALANKGKGKAHDGPDGSSSSMTIDEQRSIKSDIDFLDGMLAKEARDIIRQACAEHKDLKDDDEVCDLDLPDHVFRELRRLSESIDAMRDDLNQIVSQLHGHEIWTLSGRVTQAFPRLFKDAHRARGALDDAKNVPDDALARVVRLAQQALERQNKALHGSSQVTEQGSETHVQQYASSNNGAMPALIWTNFIVGKAASQDHVTVAEAQRRLYENFEETLASIDSWGEYNSNEVAMMAETPDSDVDRVFSLLRAGADFVEKDPPQDRSRLLSIPTEVLPEISKLGSAAQREIRKLRDASDIRERFLAPIKDCQVIIDKMRSITRAKDHLGMRG